MKRSHLNILNTSYTIFSDGKNLYNESVLKTTLDNCYTHTVGGSTGPAGRVAVRQKNNWEGL